jgi:hypothetical protein
MADAQPSPSSQYALSRRGEQLVAWLRELEECRIGGLVTDEDYGYQRAEKFAVILRPMRCLWLAPLLGVLLIGAPACTLIWLLTHDWRLTGGIAVLAGAWGGMALGRLLREKLIELQLRERRRILVALLDSDLLTANEFADYEERLLHGHQDIF